MEYITITDNPKVKTSKLMANLKKQFEVYSFWNDEELDTNFPPPYKKTTRQFKKEQESECKGQSWNEIHQAHGDEMMTLREYILFFEAYYKETGKYPDEVGWTIFNTCLPSGDVALGYWSPGSRRVRFGWDYAGSSDPGGGARLAIPVSLKPSALLPSDLEMRVKSLEAFKQKVEMILKLD